MAPEAPLPDSTGHGTPSSILQINCALCSRQCALGQTVNKCLHHCYPPITTMVAPANTRLQLQSASRSCILPSSTQDGITPRGLKQSLSVADLHEEDIHAREMESLFTAAAKCDLVTIEWLMLSGADVWQRDGVRPCPHVLCWVLTIAQEGRTVLHIAAAHGKIRMVELLVSQNADVNCPDLWGYTPLLCALNNGHFSVAQYLREHGANEPGVSAQFELSANLCSLAAQGGLDNLKILALKGVDLSLCDYDRRTPLHLAASEGHSLVCHYLVEDAKVPVNCIDRFGITPLQGAIDNGHYEVGKYLQEHGGLPSDVQTNLLIYNLMSACASGDLTSVKKIVEANSCNLNLTDYDGRSPLHLAAANGHGDIVKYLLEKGARTDTYDRWGFDPYHDAAKHSFREVIEILDPENRCSMRQTNPLDDTINDKDAMGIPDCCWRFGQRRDTVHRAMDIALREACFTSGCCYGEIWTPNRHRVALQCCQHASFLDPDLDCNVQSRLTKFYQSNLSLLIEPSAFFSGAPIRNKSLLLKDLDSVSQTLYFCAPMAKAAGLVFVLTVPINTSGSKECHPLAYAIMMHLSPFIKPDEIVVEVDALFSMMSSLLVGCARLQDDEVSRVGYVETVQRFLLKSDPLDDFSQRNLPRLVFMKELLFGLGVVKQFLEWGRSMVSEDHKAAMVLLLWLVRHIHIFESVADELCSIFRFLYTVSPLLEQESPIRSQADQALDDMRDAGFLPGKMPFFGPGLPESPVFSHINALKAHLATVYDEYKSRHETNIDRFRPPDRASLSLSPGEVFDACGSHNLPSPAFARGVFYFGATPVRKTEADYVSEFGTDLLRSMAPDELVTSSSLLGLHGGLTLQPGTSSGEFRSGLAVGSHMFYKFYRVFAPADEIPELIRMFEMELRSSNMPAVMHAYYVFAVIVCYIHPFEDGNGRVGRVFGNMILKSHGYPPVFRSNHKVITFEEFISLVEQEGSSIS